MSVRTVACANCGARYRIPESFQGAKARCKSCGATIVIATSIVEPDAPKTAAKESPKPAPKPAAKPAAARGSKAPAPKASSKERPARSGRAAPAKKSTRSKAGAASTRRGARKPAEAGADEDDAKPARRGASGRSRAAGGRATRSSGARGGRGRRGGDAEVEEKSKTPVLIGSAVGVAIIGIGIWFAMNGGGDKKIKTVDDMSAKVAAGAKEAGDAAKKTGDAVKNAANAVADKGKDAVKDAKEAASKVKKDAADAVSKTKKDAEDAGKKVADEAKKTAKKTAKKPAATKKSKVSPYDAKTELPELELPADIDAELKKKILTLADTAVQDEGIRGKRALEELSQTPRAALPALINELRKLDYMDIDYAQTGFVVHKAIEKMLMGRNVPYRAPQPGGTVKQEDAWWNAKCVKALHRFWDMVGAGDKEGWDAFIEKRKKNIAK